MILRLPSTQSSMNMKLRVCSPSPQISISWLPEICASATLRQIAAGAFSRPPVHVPCGPYTLWYRAIRVVSPKSSVKCRHIRSLNSFSHPYPSSGSAGYASLSRSGSMSGANCLSAAYTQADEEKK